MQTVTTVAGLREQIAQWRSRDELIALIPTMGALHDGHMALVSAGQRHADRSVVSLFINPRQFAPGEDLSTYPRNLGTDSAKLKAAHVDLLYVPDPDHVYPEGFATTVHVGGPADGLEAASRPEFFAGVATVVTKLFTQALPDAAVFGEKDYQQLLVVKRLVRDLDLKPRIIAVPTVRETDGLARSSRNAYLNVGQRRIAPRLYAVLSETAARLPTHDDPNRLLADAKAELHASFDKVDYLAWRDAEALQEDVQAGRAGRLLAAVVLGRTRLIDNVPVAPLNAGEG